MFTAQHGAINDSSAAPTTAENLLLAYVLIVSAHGAIHFRTDFTDLNLYCIKGALALVVLVSFSGYVC